MPSRDCSHDPYVGNTHQDHGFKARFDVEHPGLPPHFFLFPVDKSLLQSIKLFHQLAVQDSSGLDMGKPEAPRLFDKLLKRCIEGDV